MQGWGKREECQREKQSKLEIKTCMVCGRYYSKRKGWCCSMECQQRLDGQPHGKQ